MDKEKEQFINLINNNRLKMYKTAISILKNEDDAADAIQEALYSAYRNYNQLKDKKLFTTWIIRILINKCYDIINKNKKVVYIDDSITSNTYGKEDEYEVESNLDWVLNKIDKDLKELVILYYYDELSVGEIANILEVPVGTVKSRLSRARSQIANIIKKEEGEFNG